MRNTEKRRKHQESELPMPVLQFYAKHKAEIESGVFSEFHVNDGLVLAYTDNSSHSLIIHNYIH